MNSRHEVMIEDRRYSFNKSNSKYVSIELLYGSNFAPCKNEGILFNEGKWTDFLSYQRVMTNNLYSHGNTVKMYAGNFTIHFDQVSSSRVEIISDFEVLNEHVEKVTKHIIFESTSEGVARTI